MAKTRIRRGSRVYVYERENYRDSTGKVKHRNTRYLGIEVTILAYLNLALYKHHLGVAGWEGVEDSLDELGRIRKTTLDFGGREA